MTAIGVTGHRSLNDPTSIIRGIERGLNKIREVFAEPYVLYSSLAEGADRLAVERARAILQAELIVPLPMSLMDDLADFSPDSQAELAMLLQGAQEVIELPAQVTHEAAYEAAGRFILEQIDVLIVVWDGQPARGQGGTGQIVAEARQQRLPVAWVLAGEQNSRFKKQYRISNPGAIS